MEQPKVVAKQEVAAPVAAAPAVAASEPAPQQSKEESLQEKLADAMQPAFDEVGSKSNSSAILTAQLLVAEAMSSRV